MRYRIFGFPSKAINAGIMEGSSGRSPRVDLIRLAPSLEQESQVNVPELNVYHLIKGSYRYSEFKMGFCKREKDGSLIYATEILDPRSSLYRYVAEDLAHEESFGLFQVSASSQDRLLLKYMTVAIKKAGGLTQDTIKNRVSDAWAVRDPSVWREVCEANFHDLLHHVAYGEEEEVRKILTLESSLLLSTYSASVVSCAPEIEFPRISAFQLAVVGGDWLMWQMMLDLIKSEKDTNKKAYLEEDIRGQLQEIKENGVDYYFDNLLNKGLQILDADHLQDEGERKRYELDVIHRNSYHLIVKTQVNDGKRFVTSCRLGFRGEAKDYLSPEIPEQDPLFGIAIELYQLLKKAHEGRDSRHKHYITRAHRDLKMTRDFLHALGVKTQSIEKTDGLNCDFLKDQLETRISNWGAWSGDRLWEHWHACIASATRLFPANVWQFWMSNELAWTVKEELILDFLLHPSRRELGENSDYYPLFPISCELGNTYVARANPGSEVPLWLKSGSERSLALLKGIQKVADIKRSELGETLRIEAKEESVFSVAPAYSGTASAFSKAC